MTSARLTISTASDRWRALRFNSRLSGGAKTTLPKLMPTNIQHTHNESLTYCTSQPEWADKWYPYAIETASSTTLLSSFMRIPIAFLTIGGHTTLTLMEYSVTRHPGVIIGM